MQFKSLHDRPSLGQKILLVWNNSLRQGAEVVIYIKDEVVNLLNQGEKLCAVFEEDDYGIWHIQQSQFESYQWISIDDLVINVFNKG